MRKNRKKGLLFEALLILILSLVLSFIYNTVSPTGIELLPERVLKKKSDIRKSPHPLFAKESRMLSGFGKGLRLVEEVRRDFIK